VDPVLKGTIAPPGASVTGDPLLLNAARNVSGLGFHGLVLLFHMMSEPRLSRNCD
jgi:hypothetical protein